MTSMNRVFLAGNLTRDPEVRYTPNGTAVASLGLAVNDSYRNRTGETVDRTCFVDVQAWGRQAETCGEYLAKGSPVLIEGALEFDQWETQQGEKRSKLRVRAFRVQFLGAPRRGAPADAPDTKPRSAPPAADKEHPGREDEPLHDDEDLPF